LVLAERHGQTAARNMLGYGEKFTDVPFFWSQHYDVPINYAGHAEKWEESMSTATSRAKTACCASSAMAGCWAVASIFRDVENLQAEVAMEKTAAV
jgi:hypothetical protein